MAEVTTARAAAPLCQSDRSPQVTSSLLVKNITPNVTTHKSDCCAASKRLPNLTFP